MGTRINEIIHKLAGEDLAEWRRVKFSAAASTTVVYADADEKGIGLTTRPASSGNPVAILLDDQGMTVKVTGADSFSAGALLYPAADGKVTDSGAPNATPRYRALEACSADGGIVEALPLVNADMGQVPLILHMETDDAATADVTLWTNATGRVFKITDYKVRSRDTTAANISVKNDGTLISSAVLAKGTTDEALVRAATILEAQEDVADGDAITVEASATAAFSLDVIGFLI